ncbi:MAG: hypothetical protein K0S76_2012 [Herbinix sp.]|jgi:hypothetical protein|nr:hypothetical protein [Herbinix sp.]
MGKGKKRTTATIMSMVVVGAAIVLFYFYWVNRTDPLDETSVEELTDVQKLLQKDLDTNYPETPREVVKLHSNMLKILYTELNDEDTQALALKIRELYDEEFLANNPETTYLKDLYAEISEWKKVNRKIANYILVNEDQEQENTVDGEKYADVYVSYTIQEKGKFAEVWRFLLRMSDEGKWKILGWKFVPDEK